MILAQKRAKAQRGLQQLVVREQFERWFEQAAEVLRVVGIPMDYARTDIGYSVPEHMNAQWATLRRAFLALDYTSLSAKDHARLHRQLTAALPKLLTKFSRAIVELDHQRTYTGTFTAALLDDRRQRSQNVAARISNQQQQVNLSKRLNAVLAVDGGAAALTTKRNLELSRAGRPALPQVAELGKLDSQLEKAAQRLLADWQVAWARVLGPEDRYRLEQIATSHLPELMGVLPELGADAKSEAVALAGEQLELLHAQVRRMLARRELDAMGVLRAQNAFIRELDAQSGTRLTLRQSIR